MVNEKCQSNLKAWVRRPAQLCVCDVLKTYFFQVLYTAFCVTADCWGFQAWSNIVEDKSNTLFLLVQFTLQETWHPKDWWTKKHNKKQCSIAKYMWDLVCTSLTTVSITNKNNYSWHGTVDGQVRVLVNKGIQFYLVSNRML